MFMVLQDKSTVIFCCMQGTLGKVSVYLLDLTYLNSMPAGFLKEQARLVSTNTQIHGHDAREYVEIRVDCSTLVYDMHKYDI